MGSITLSEVKRVDPKDLESYIALSQARDRALEERIARTEREIEKIYDEQKANKRIIIGAMLSTATGIFLMFMPKFAELLVKG